MTSEKEHQVIHEFLKWYDVRYIEIYEELYDHVVTSFENREDQSQGIKAHINEVVKPELGMSDGIYAILRENQKSFKNEIHKRALSIFKSYLFGWPGILTTIVILALALILPEFIDTTNVYILIVLGLAILSVSGTIFIIAFRLNSRLKKSLVRRSLKNHIVDRFISAGVIIIVMSYVFIDKWNNASQVASAILETKVAAAIGIVLFTLYALVCIRLVREKFQFKLDTV